MEARIELTSDKIVQLKPYRVSLLRQKIMKDKVDEMLRQGIISPSMSSYASPAILVPKGRSGEFRFVVDYRLLNTVTKTLTYSIPRVEDCLNWVLEKGKFVSMLDLNSAFWQLPLDEASRRYTAFSTPFGNFEFNRLPFGLKNSSFYFQKLINKVFEKEWLDSVVAYQDDIIVVSPTYEKHLEHLRNVFRKLRDAKLTVNVKKSRFLCSTFDYLGFTIKDQTLSPQSNKIQAIHQFPEPRNVKQLRSFLGLANFYRCFIPNFATIAEPLTALLQKGRKFDFSEECRKAFEELKNALQSSRVLYSPRHDLPFILNTDASDIGVGCVIRQEQQGKLVTIAFGSKKFSKSQAHYTAMDREAYALVWALNAYQYILEGAKIKVYTDNAALSYVFKTSKNARLLRWALQLQQYDLEVHHQKGRFNKIADILSRNFARDEGEGKVCNVVNVFEPSLVLSDELIKAHQTLDVEIQNIVANVNDPRYKFYVVKDGILYRKDKYRVVPNVSNVVKLTRLPELRYVIPDSLVEAVVTVFHDQPFMGHFSAKRTMARLKALVYFKKMNAYVKKFVRRCPKCQLSKQDNRVPIGTLGKVVAGYPFEIVALDFVGPLPRTKEGYVYALVVYDLFTRWPECIPLRRATAEAVVGQLQTRLIPTYGVPRVIITDNGTQFAGDEFESFLQALGIEHRFTSPYNPRANPAERVIRSIKAQLRCWLQGTSHAKWAEQLPAILFALRTVQGDTTDFSPAELLFGRNLAYPASLVVSDVQHQTCATTSDYVMGLLEWYERAYDRVAKRTEQRWQRNAGNFNKKVQQREFEVNDVVKMKRFVLSSKVKGVNAKLAPIYVGPCVVIKKHSALRYDVQDKTTKKVYVNCHISHLRPFYCE